jgi:hypothetical protein
MMIRKIDLVQRSAFLLFDAPPDPPRAHNRRFPPINHILAHNYAKALEPLLISPHEEATAKIVSLLYVKLFSHTAKHLIHKYNRHKSGFYKFKIWGLYDFHRKEGKVFPYVEYPRMEDLVSLKREVMNRTTIKVKDMEMDKALENMNFGALDEFKEYSMLEFFKDLELGHLFWNVMIDYMLTIRDREQIKQEN